MQNVRLKASLDPLQIENRLQYEPEIMELHLVEEDLYHPESLVEVVRALKVQGIQVYLHHPMRYKGKFLDIISSSQEIRDFYDWSSWELAAICKQEKIQCVIHCHYANTESSDYMDFRARKEMRQRVEKLLSISEVCFLWEDTIKGIFSAENPYLFSEIIQPLELPLNIDVSHAFIALQGDNERLQQHLEIFHPYANYFHLVDSFGENHDALPLGQGNIDWNMVKHYVGEKDFIFEIDLKRSGFLDCTPMMRSVEYFNKI
ncbi:TIM barrel protein [Oceanobacillus damuensis]|uniref:TIM barrel protein n=1 Tax=Oceanobacillus damuensis TaxID=937928 RepID=UPI000836E582|nr:TIM barrel protein [Oceanobacillus damuensis]